MIIKRKYYSNPTLKQKEYGLKSAIKKSIDKLRDKLGDKLVEASKNKWRKNLIDNADSYFEDKATPRNKKLADNLIKEADKHGIKVLDNNKFSKALGTGDDVSDYIEKPSPETVMKVREINEEIQKDPRASKDMKDVFSAISSGKEILSVSDNADKKYNIISHEIGHKIRRETKKGRKLAEKVDKFKKDEDRLGFIGSIKKRSAIIKHEQDANKEGRRLMKKAGATGKELRRYDKSRKLSTNTYRSAEDSKVLKNAAKKVYTKNNKDRAEFNDL